MRHARTLMIVAALGAAVAAAGSCKDAAPQAAAPGATPDAGPAPSPPDITRPPPVQSAMWSLAVKTNDIVTLLAQPARTPEELERIKQAVDDVGKIAAGLGVDPIAKRHPLVRKGLEEFKVSVVAAQAGLAKDPPDLASVAGMTAACQRCHARGEPSPPPFAL